jgi:methionyl-tRNA formyltransferase
MRVVFVTHNELGRTCLETLIEHGADIEAIYTRPNDEQLADWTSFDDLESKGIPVHRVESVNDPAVKEQIAGYEPEYLFVVGWSSLVDRNVIDIPSVAAIGMHPSPLPQGRGRAPLAWSLIKGFNETSLSMFHLEPEADAGDLVAQQPIEITLQDDVSSLYEKTVAAGRELIRTRYADFESRDVPRKSQNEADATWWPRRRPHHGLIDWTREPMSVYNWIRGQSRPYPGAYSYLNNRKVTVWGARPPTGGRTFVKPGEIVSVDGEAVTVGVWEGVVELIEVQVEDEEQVPASALVAAHDFEVGDRFTNARDRIEG